MNLNKSADELAAMVRRLANTGLTVEQISASTGLPLVIVRQILDSARRWVVRP